MTKFQNGFSSTSVLSDDLLKRLGVSSASIKTAANDRRQHAWITVVDPTNRRSLLQACDDCGVVKSENSVIRNCKADFGMFLISSSLASSA